MSHSTNTASCTAKIVRPTRCFSRSQPARASVTILFLFLHSILLATAAQSLAFDDDLLVYAEDFAGEATYPTTPEVNQIGSAGHAAFGVPSGSAPALEGGAVSFELIPILSGGDYYQQVAVPAGDLATGTRGFRSRWEDLEVAADAVPIALVTAVGGSTASFSFSAFAILDVDWTTPGIRPVISLDVGDAVAFDILDPQIDIISGVLSEARVDQVLAGAVLTIDLKVDDTLQTITGSIALDGATVLTVGPKPFMYFGAEPFQEFRAAFSTGTTPATTVSADQRVELTDFELFVPFAEAYVVDSTSDEVDSNPGDGDCESASGFCTLRAAVQESNANPGASKITFSTGSPSSFALARTGEGEDAASTGDLDVLDDLAIRGNGIESTIIDGLSQDRVFHVPQVAMDTIFELSDLTVRGGDASSATSRAGGGIDSWGNTTIRRSAIDDNVAGYGGGIFNRRDLRLIDSRVRDNLALLFTGGGGGGRAGGIGGGVFGESSLDPTIEIIRSSIEGNYADSAISGAEFLGSDSVLIEHSTFTGNTGAGFDRALQLTNSNAVLRHVTLVGDTGFGIGSTGAPVDVEIANSVVNGETAACTLTTNPAVTVVYSGNNASNDTTCGFSGASDIEGENLGLMPAVLIGNFFVNPPDETSPLLDAADPAFCFGGVDQVGTLRPLDSDSDGSSVCELGAIEVPEPDYPMLLSAGVIALGIASRRRAQRSRAGVL